MKAIALAVLIAGALVGTAAESDAAVCAAGAYHAGCATRHGAVVTTHPPAARCHVDRYGRRVCVR